MKEILKHTLTNEAQKPYSGYGDKIMPGENGEGQIPPQKPPEGSQNPAGKNNINGEQKQQGPINDEARFAQEIGDIEKKFNIKWDEWPLDLRRATIDSLRSKRSSESGTGAPKTETGGSGGAKKPPEEPPVATEAADNQQPDQEGPGLPLVDISEGITDQKLLNEAKTIKAMIETGVSPEKVFVDALARIGLLDTNYGTEEEQDSRAQQKQDLMKKIQDATRRIIVNNYEERKNTRQPGLYGERKLLDFEIKEIKDAKRPEQIEELFNRMFDTVDSLPQVEFDAAFGSIGQFEYAEFMKTLNEAISEQSAKGDLGRVKELGDIRAQFSKEKSARTVIHNAYYALITGQNTEAMSNYMNSFLTGYADLAFAKEGVVQAMHTYEQALLIVRERHGGFLPPKAVIGEMSNNEPGEVNQLAEDLLKAEAGGRLKKWEVDRALSFARGLSVATGRTIEIAATCIVPGVESGGSAFNDVFAQRILQEIFPFRHLNKFHANHHTSKILAYLLDRKKSPWSPKELKVFHKMKLPEQIKVLNDLMPEGQERFYSVLNPFMIGGWLSNTGWRIGGDSANPGESAIKNMLGDPKEAGWIGTGIIIEKERGNLEKLKSKDPAEIRRGKLSRRKIEEALKKTARVTPLRLFLNVREFKERVLMDLLEDKIGIKDKDGKEKKFFTDDERTALKREIEAKFQKEQGIRTNIKKDEAELLKDVKLKALKEKSPKDKAKEAKESADELRRKISLEIIMSDPKLSDAINNLVILQEQAILTRSESLVTGDNGGDLGKILSNKFLNEIAGEVPGKKEEETFLQQFVRKLEHKGWKTPFIFGTEDIPFDKYVFEETGARSTARRWADMGAAAKAGGEFQNLMKGLEVFEKPEQLVEQMHKVYEHIKDYNAEYAEQFSMQLAEGVMKFYGKSWDSRLPLGIGYIKSAIGKSSYAQMAFGKGKMAWDELQKNEFTRQLRDKGIITADQQHKLQGRAGGGKKDVVWSYTRTMVPLLMLAMLYYMASRAIKEKG